MTLERIFGKIVFYIIEIAAKGFAGYLMYCGLLAFTNNGLGSLYIGMATFLILVVVGWNMDKISEEAIQEQEYEIVEEIE
jgi:Na+-translocating ferredoxin:NAD+ oxidoreductase RnfE subunit